MLEDSAALKHNPRLGRQILVFFIVSTILVMTVSQLYAIFREGRFIRFLRRHLHATRDHREAQLGNEAPVCPPGGASGGQTS